VFQTPDDPQVYHQMNPQENAQSLREVRGRFGIVAGPLFVGNC
jgi:hypothetical protein